MTEEDFRETYARALAELANARHQFAPVFRQLVVNIEDEALYSRGTLANLARDQGIVDANGGRMLFVLLGHVLNRADLPDDGDGTIEPHGVPIPAWRGMRWKAALWKIVVEDETPPVVAKVLIKLKWKNDE